MNKKHPKENPKDLPAPPVNYPAFTPSKAEEGFDPRRYVSVLWSRVWLILAICLGMLALGSVHLNRAEPVFSASATIKYESSRRQLVDVAGLEDSGALTNEIATQVEVIRSPRIIARVIDSIGLERTLQETDTFDRPISPLARVSEFFRDVKNKVSRQIVSFEIEPLAPEIANRQRLEESIAARLRVNQVFGTKVISISYQDTNRELTAQVANEFANQYILELADENRRALEQASIWFDEQVQEAEERLKRAEEAQLQYKGVADIRVLQQNYEIASETMRSLGTEIQRQKTKLARLNTRNEAALDEALWPALLADVPEYDNLRKRIDELEFSRAARAAEDTERHPEVLRLDREIDLLTKQLNERAKRLIEDFKTEARLAQLELESLENRRSEQESLVESIQAAMIEYRVLEREVDSSRELYSALLARSKQIAVGVDTNTSSVTILSPARVPEYQSSPRIMQTLILFGLFGLFLGTGMVLIIDKFDRSVKDPAYIEERFGIPTLGLVPFLRPPGRKLLRGGRKQGHSPLVTGMDPNSHSAEAFRLLRTSLQYSTAGSPPKVLLFTSSFPREGKSTVAANLAISHALRGDKVLLIDGDLKRPVVHKTFDLKKEPGLSDVLTGQKKINDALLTSEVENLFVLTAGHDAPSPGDLLESQTMADLLDDMRTQYDMVIIDSPPVAGIADALILSRSVDGICLIVDRGKTPIDAFSKVISVLDQVQAPILGVVYNARHRGSGASHRSSYYGYGYGYGYGARGG
ncbi:MAG: polysaccharide biosynthesis tyrosine autokinase [Candidatus Sumerlaeia bacterium]|nr:polysaccharide biosynthesis tyrosine autokinase [Candidatus Sumerlaeia bacterium]